MLTMNPIYGYTGSLKTNSGYPLRQFAGFFMPSLWRMIAENILNIGKPLFGFSESATSSNLKRLLKQTGVVMTNQIVAFKGQNLSIINQNHQPYFSSQDVAKALGYARCDKITQIYNRHADEFTPDMSDTLNLRLSGNLTTTTRVFSLRGCHLLAMFSKTPVAKEFRRWVLDLIEQRNQTISKMETTTLDAKTLGGVVKRCTAAAVREEVGNAFAAQAKSMFADFAIKTFAMGQDLKPFQRVTDDMLLRGLYDWYATKHHDFKQAIDDLTAENDRLKSKIATIRKTAEE